MAKQNSALFTEMFQLKRIKMFSVNGMGLGLATVCGNYEHAIVDQVIKT
jgi:hypothetical protein